MQIKTEQLLHQVKQLPEDERWEILAQLMDNLHVQDDFPDDDAWNEELDRRMAAAHAGSPGIPAEEVHASILKKLRGQ